MPILETPKSEIYSSFRTPSKHKQNISISRIPASSSSYSLSNSPLLTPNVNLIVNDDVVELSGLLLKWTDYLKGYRKRWFVLTNGVLSYYSIKNKQAHACKASMNLANAYVENEYYSTNFTIYDGRAQKFYLKAKNEHEKQRWLAAIEISKNKFANDDYANNLKVHEYQCLLNEMKQKLNDLNQCYSLIEMNSNELARQLDGLEKMDFIKKDLNYNNELIQDSDDDHQQSLNSIHDKAKLFKTSMDFMLNNIKVFTNLANRIGEEKENVTQIEIIKRKQLDDMIKKFNRIQKSAEESVKKKHLRLLQKKTDDETLPKVFENENENKKATTRLSIDKLNKIKTESELTSLLAMNNSITNNNQLKFKQNSFCDFNKQSSKDDDDDKKNIIIENDDDDVDSDFYHDAIEEEEEEEEEKEIVAEKQVVAISKLSEPKLRRREIPQRPSSNLNCLEFIKNCVGKSLDEIPIPFNYREPISMLQRVVEEIENTGLLDKASKCTNQWEQMTYVAAFSVSCYNVTQRTYKPFNSLLGETFEYDCSGDVGENVGWRAIAEQISVTPPTIALHIESLTHDWQLYHEFSMTSKFRLQYLQVIPACTTHLTFKKSQNHYTWNKVNTFVHNLMVGKMWIENVGDIDIVNHKTKDVCHMKYSPYNYFSSKSTNKVSGVVTDADKIARYVLNGMWTDHVEAGPVIEPKILTKQLLLKSASPTTLWKKKPISSHMKNMYNFSDFTIRLNEPETGVAPTDSRNRPDQRLMEQGLWDDASKETHRVEEKQRSKLKSVAQHSEYAPLWFTKITDSFTNQQIHVFNNQYWSNKEKNDWNSCPDLY